MMKVLIVRTSSMGDLIHTLPALTDLVRHVPNIEIDWLAEENFADIPMLHPAVKSVIPIAWRRWRKHLCSPATWGQIRALKTHLKSMHWDKVIDAQGLIKSAIPARLAGAPVAGYDAKSIREPIASLFYSQRFAVSRACSAVARNRKLFSEVFGYAAEGVPEFGIQCPARVNGLPTVPYAVLLHGTSRASKEWPEINWVGCGAQLYRDKGLISLIPWGSEAERLRANRLADAIPHAIVAPRVNLWEAASMLGHAQAVIGVDTGLAHLANALAVPLVAIYTDTDPALTGVVETPLAVNLGGIGCMPKPEEVLETLSRLLREGK